MGDAGLAVGRSLFSTAAVLPDDHVDDDVDDDVYADATPSLRHAASAFANRRAFRAVELDWGLDLEEDAKFIRARDSDTEVSLPALVSFSSVEAI
jgi:hypothetical protein